MKTIDNPITSVNISHLKSLKRQIDNINQLDLKNVIFLDENDKKIEIDSKIIADWKYTGLNNMDFILTDFYKNGFDETTTEEFKD